MKMVPSGLPSMIPNKRTTRGTNRYITAWVKRTKDTVGNLTDKKNQPIKSGLKDHMTFSNK